jgi:dihydrofolate reductase
MRKVVYSVAMSLDGFIAGPNGEADWIVMDPDIDFGSMFARFDTIVMGRKTYEMTRTAQGAGMPGIRSYVFSRSLNPADCPGVAVATDAVMTVDQLRSGSGKDIWLFGGGQLFASLALAGLVDRIEVGVIPVMLGAGADVVVGRIVHSASPDRARGSRDHRNRDAHLSDREAAWPRRVSWAPPETNMVITITAAPTEGREPAVDDAIYMINVVITPLHVAPATSESLVPRRGPSTREWSTAATRLSTRRRR